MSAKWGPFCPGEDELGEMVVSLLGHLLLTWINFNPNMDK